MSKHKVTIGQVRQRLKKLSTKPAEFDQLVMAERVELARVLCDDAFSLYGRRKNKQEEQQLWQEAALMFHRAIAEAYPPGFDQDFEWLRLREDRGLETAITFLEIDPWFFRSGYVKADLLKFICRVPLSQSSSMRLQKVVLAAIDLRDRREFRWYCKLAKVVQSTELRRQVEERLESDDSGVRRRARWVLSTITHNTTFHLNRGVQQFYRHNYRAAIGDFKRAILLEPGCVRAFVWRGAAFARLRLFDEALADLEQVIELSSSDFVEKHNYKSEGRHLLWMPVRGKECEARKWRSWIYAEQRKYELSVTELTHLIQGHHQNDPYCYVKRGRALYNLKQYELAVDDLNKCLLLDRDDEAHYLRGLCYVAQEQHHWAKNDFEAALELNPDDFAINIDASKVYFRLGIYQRALELADKAIDLAPEKGQGYCSRGKALLGLKRYEEAIADLDKSIEINMTLWKGEAFYWRASIYKNLGQMTQALENLRHAEQAGYDVRSEEHPEGFGQIEDNETN